MKNISLSPRFSTKLNGLFLLLTITLLWSCDTDKKTEEKITAAAPLYVPPFNADSAYWFVEKQVAFGPRVPNTKAHNNTGDFILNRLKAYGWAVEEQNFEASTFDEHLLYLRNIIASYRVNAPKRILLATHWDTRPFADKDNERKNEPIDGANDGASGVAVLLEIARAIATYDSLEIGVDLIFFDGEDWGNDMNYHGNVPLRDGLEAWWCLGSQHWSKNKHRANYSAYFGILLDMVGGKNAQFWREGYSNEFAPSIVDRVWRAGAQLGYDRFFINKAGGGITDDHYFVNKYAKIPMIDIIPTDPADGSFGSFHHTHADNISAISNETLRAVGETVLYVVYNEQ